MKRIDAPFRRRSVRWRTAHCAAEKVSWREFHFLRIREWVAIGASARRFCALSLKKCGIDDPAQRAESKSPG
ncbi:MAG: hypothetical protein MUP61_04690 [Burkholderiales bacterium]|nr:hypothetical protein [Burkholderiales bacterium]MCJ7838497.1 hypothetical protein [Burkholderiales bacterium]